ncbi:MAG TPA: hypothetical protein ENH41_03380 [Candidatus Omnitrophica bacterium]|nr:hypothetical protein [Candidatus Omnitrophota bacterium]
MKKHTLKGKVPKEMDTINRHKPYQIITVRDAEFWDYNFKIKGIIYEISVNTKTGRLYINKDQDQNRN